MPPEFKQPFGTKSKQQLSNLVFGKTVTVKKTGVDRYKRPLAFLQLNGTDINAKMVQTGFAWNYPQFSKSQTLPGDQEGAKKKKAGLWVDKKPIPPWEWRRKKK